MSARTATFALAPDRLWDGLEERPKKGMAVLVEGPRVAAICRIGDIPARTEIKRLTGCTLLPGLIDTHVHYSPVMGPSFLAAGVTTIRDVGNDLESILALRRWNETHLAAGPTIVCCGFLLDGKEGYWEHKGRAHANAAQIRAAVRHEVARGVDAIKLYAGVDLRLLRAAVDEAHRQNMHTLAHLGDVTAADAARAGLDEIQHLTGCEAGWSGPAAQTDALIDILLRHNVSMTPTLVVLDRMARILDLSLAHDERRRWTHPVFLEIWNRYHSRFGPPENRLRAQRPLAGMKACLRRMHERGMTIALGTDTPFPHVIPGFSVHDELCLYVDAGIRPLDALRSATSVSAKVLGIARRAGRIAPGMPADLVAVKGDPFERIDEISRVEVTFRNGRAFTQKQLLRSARALFARAPDDANTRDLLETRLDRRRTLPRFRNYERHASQTK